MLAIANLHAMNNDSSEMLPLNSSSSHDLPGTDEKYHYHDSHLSDHLRRKNRFLKAIVAFQALVIVASFFTILGIKGSASSTANTPFSPARSLLRSETKVFTDGLKEITIYQGNETLAEKAWEDLYLGTTMRLSREQAIQLPNRTLPINNDRDHYIAQLDVFHELHCLNSIRRVMNGEHHPGFSKDHMSHCLDSIRQYIMCNIDVSVIVWRWDPEEKAANPAFTHPHQCSNFEEIQDWAKANSILPGWDKFAFVEDDLPEPPAIS